MSSMADDQSEQQAMMSVAFAMSCEEVTLGVSALQSSPTVATFAFGAQREKRRLHQQEDIEQLLRFVHPEAFLEQQQQVAGGASTVASAATSTTMGASTNNNNNSSNSSLLEQDAILVPWFLRHSALHTDPASPFHHSFLIHSLQQKFEQQPTAATLRDHTADLCDALLLSLRLCVDVAIPRAAPAIRDCDAAKTLRTAVHALIELDKKQTAAAPTLEDNDDDDDAERPKQGRFFASDEFVSLPGRRALLAAAASVASLCLKSFMFHGIIYGVGDVERTSDFTSKLLKNLANALSDLVTTIEDRRRNPYQLSPAPSPAAAAAASFPSDKNNSSSKEENDDDSPERLRRRHSLTFAPALSRRASSLLAPSSNASRIGRRHSSNLRRGTIFAESHDHVAKRSSPPPPPCSVTSASSAILFFAVSSALLSVNCVAFVDLLLVGCVASCKPGANALLELLLDALEANKGGGGDADDEQRAFHQRRVLLCGESIASSTTKNFIATIAAGEGTSKRQLRALFDILESGSVSVRFLFTVLFTVHRKSGSSMTSCSSSLLWDLHGSSSYFRCVVGDLLRAGCCGGPLLSLLLCADDDEKCNRESWTALLCTLDSLRLQNSGALSSDSAPVRVATALSWAARFLLANASAGLAHSIVQSCIEAASASAAGESDQQNNNRNSSNSSISRVMCELVYGIPGWALEVWRRRGASAADIGTMKRMLDVQAQLGEAGLVGPSDLAPENPSRCQPAAEHHFRALLVEFQRRRRLLLLAAQNDEIAFGLLASDEEEEQHQQRLMLFFAVREQDDAESEEKLAEAEIEAAGLLLRDSSTKARSGSSSSGLLDATGKRKSALRHAPAFRLWHVAPLLRPGDADEIQSHVGSTQSLWESTFREQLNFLSAHLLQQGQQRDESSTRTNWSAQRAPQHVVQFAAAVKRELEFCARGAHEFLLHGATQQRRLSQYIHKQHRLSESNNETDDNENDGEITNVAAADGDPKMSPSSVVAKMRARAVGNNIGSASPASDKDSSSFVSPARCIVSMDSHVQRMRQLREKQDAARQVALSQLPLSVNWSPSSAAAAAAANCTPQRTIPAIWALTPSPNRAGHFVLAPASSSTLVALSPQQQRAPNSNSFGLIVPGQNNNMKKHHELRAVAHRRAEKHKREVQEKFSEIVRRRQQRERELEPEIDRWFSHLERDDTRDLRLRMWTAVHHKRQLTASQQRSDRLQLQFLIVREWLQVRETDLRRYEREPEETAAWSVLLFEAARSVVMARSYEQRRAIRTLESGLILGMHLACQRSWLEQLEKQQRRHAGVDEAAEWIRGVLLVAARERFWVVETERRRSDLARPEAASRRALKSAEQRGRLEAAELTIRRVGTVEPEGRSWRLLLHREQRARIEAQEQTARRRLSAADEPTGRIRCIAQPAQRSHLQQRALTMLRIWREVEAATRTVHIEEPAAREAVEAECRAVRRVECEGPEARRWLEGICEAMARSAAETEQAVEMRAIVRSEAAARKLAVLTEEARLARKCRIPMPHLALMVESHREGKEKTATTSSPSLADESAAESRTSFTKSTARFWALPALVLYFNTDEEEKKKQQLQQQSSRSGEEDRESQLQREAEILEQLRNSEQPSSPIALVQSHQYRDEGFRMLLIGAAERSLVKARAEQVSASERNRLLMLRAAEQSAFGPSPNKKIVVASADSPVPHLQQRQQQQQQQEKQTNTNDKSATMSHRELLVRHEAMLLRSLTAAEKGTPVDNKVEMYLFDHDDPYSCSPEQHQRRLMRSIAAAQQGMATRDWVVDAEYRAEGERLLLLQRSEWQLQQGPPASDTASNNNNNNNNSLTKRRTSDVDNQSMIIPSSVIASAVTAAPPEVDATETALAQLHAELRSTMERYDGELADFDEAISGGGRKEDADRNADADEQTVALRQMRREMIGLRDSAVAAIEAQIAEVALKKQEQRQPQAIAVTPPWQTAERDASAHAPAAAAVTTISAVADDGESPSNKSNPLDKFEGEQRQRGASTTASVTHPQPLSVAALSQSRAEQVTKKSTPTVAIMQQPPPQSNVDDDEF